LFAQQIFGGDFISKPVGPPDDRVEPDQLQGVEALSRLHVRRRGCSRPKQSQLSAGKTWCTICIK
jgi:hypothetical protein